MTWKTVYAPAVAAAFAAFAMTGGIQASEKVIKAEEQVAPANGVRATLRASSVNMGTHPRAPHGAPPGRKSHAKG
ncbi:hypothetical protein BH10PSE13_BH10PSE13_13850 [soil metagenome]